MGKSQKQAEAAEVVILATIAEAHFMCQPWVEALYNFPLSCSFCGGGALKTILKLDDSLELTTLNARLYPWLRFIIGKDRAKATRQR